jgi:hypothetical protein
MALTNTETVGLAEQFVQFLQDNKTTLQTLGLDVTDWITNVGALKTDAVTQIAKQDDLETQKKIQTKVAKTSTKTLYDDVSTKIDAASGVLGKNTPAAKQLKSLRSSLIKNSKSRKKNDEES